MLKKRIFTAAILIAIIVFMLQLGGIALNIFLCIVYFLMQMEVYSFTIEIKDKHKKYLSLLSLILPFSYLYSGVHLFFISIIIYVLLIAAYEIFRVERERHLNLNAEVLLIYLLSIAYIGLLGTAMLVVANKFSINYIYWIILVVCSADTFAYFTGRLFGKHKITPRVSPNKSMEGIIGGLFAAIFFATIYKTYFYIDISNSKFIIFTLIFVISSILGDLFESYIKRIYNKKDSGIILPGHGGVLDRMDSLLFTIPILLILELFIK